MNKSIKQFGDVASNPWFVVANAVAVLAAFMWFIYGHAVSMPSPASIVLLIIALIIFSAGNIYSIQIRAENIILRGIAEEFYEINQIYQQTLSDLFYDDPPASNPTELLAKEEQVLKAVCQRINSIFSRVINRKCMVTIKLVTVDNGKLFAHTYVRSQEICIRDISGRVDYEIGSGNNTGFDIALTMPSDGKPPHFFSADLRECANKFHYKNARENYFKYYKSTLVVPIQRISNANSNEPTKIIDLIGFLCVDTLSVNRLNDGYHLHMLSALSSQMYNFMSLMRGRYVVGVEETHN